MQQDVFPKFSWFQWIVERSGLQALGTTKCWEAKQMWNPDLKKNSWKISEKTTYESELQRENISRGYVVSFIHWRQDMFREIESPSKAVHESTGWFRVTGIRKRDIITNLLPPASGWPYPEPWDKIQNRSTTFEEEPEKWSIYDIEGRGVDSNREIAHRIDGSCESWLQKGCRSIVEEQGPLITLLNAVTCKLEAGRWFMKTLIPAWWRIFRWKTWNL